MALNTTIFTVTYIKYIDKQNDGITRLGFVYMNFGDGTLMVGRLADTDYIDREALENNVDGCIIHGIPFHKDNQSDPIFTFDIIQVYDIIEVNPEWD